MRTRFTFTAILLSLALSSFVFGETASVEALLNSAASPDKPAADAAVAELRAGGPESLAKLFEIRDKLAASSAKPSTEKLDAIIDQVGGARYCTASRLYWHTDLAQAQDASKKSGKPILSLRMMGYLTDEFSCANSRFFRTSLYANKEISDYLRDHYVLHWKSVRPVPKVTIDFGDGRKLERTLTGNSIHYVLASDGTPLDALPGLYAPARFKSWLVFMTEVARYSEQGPDQRAEALEFCHNQGLEQIARAWESDINKISGPPEAKKSRAASLEELRNALAHGQGQAEPKKAPEKPRADAAAEIARPKALLEMPVIRAVASIKTLEQRTDDAMWEKIAALHLEEAKLDEASIRLIRSENPTAARAARVAITKSRVEDPVIRMVAAFQSSIALDTVRNEYVLHRKLHQWFLDGSAGKNVEALNERVYAELFLTPKSDPWIGLVPDNTYTALDNAGVVKPAAK